MKRSFVGKCSQNTALVHEKYSEVQPSELFSADSRTENHQVSVLLHGIDAEVYIK